MLLSVIVPVLRFDSYTQFALDSLVPALNGIDSEVIIVSTDDCNHLMSRYENSGLFRFLTVNINTLTYKLNLAIDSAQGYYIARFDSDDLCEPERFKVQLDFLKVTEYDFCFGDARVINTEGDLIGRKVSDSSSLDFKCDLIHPTMMCYRSVILKLGGYANIEYSEDYMLWLSAVSSGFSIGTINEPMISYRVHDSQMTSSNNLSPTFARNTSIKLYLLMKKFSFRLMGGFIYDFIKTFYARFFSRL